MVNHSFLQAVVCLYEGDIFLLCFFH